MYDCTYIRNLAKSMETQWNRDYGELWGGRKGKPLFNGYNVSEWDDEKFWKSTVVTVV